MDGIKSPDRILWVALVIGWSADVLFYGKRLGVSLLLFTALVTASLFLLGRWEGKRPSRSNLWLLLPLFFFAGMAFVRANEMLTFFNVAATAALLGYLAFFYAEGRVTAVDTLGAFLIPLRTAGHSAALTPSLVTASPLLKEAQRQGWRRFAPVVRGGLLALPVLAVFGLLLTSADVVFAGYIQSVLSLDLFSQMADGVWRGFVILSVTWLAAGGLVFALHKRRSIPDRSALEEGLGGLPRHFSLGFTETAVVLTLVNGLFLAFVAVQFAYLFGGMRVPELGYAEYARRGFFELVMVAVLSLGLILGLHWLTRRSAKRQIHLFNGLGSVLMLLVGVMLVSAWRRMQLYEAAFGYTELRLTVYVFMVWLALLLGWFVWTLWRRPYSFGIGLVLAAMGFLVTLNLINPDAFIVRQNVARYQVTGDLDAAYLTRLSNDAAPELVQAYAAVQGDAELVLIPACAYGYVRDGECEATRAEILRDMLHGRSQQLEEDRFWQRWPSYHLAHRRAYAYLSALHPGGQG